MARSETAQIIVQVRGAIKAAQESGRVADAQDELGDEVDESGRAALRAAAAFERLQKKLNQVTRASALNTGAISLGTLALGAMLAVTLGLAITAMPALISVLGAATVVVGAFAAAILGVGVAAGVMAFAAVQRFKETSDVAGSVAARLQQQAGLLSNAFSDATARGATAVLAGLIPLLRGVRGLVHDLEPAFTGLGQAIGGALRWFGEGIRELAPELTDLFGAAEGVFQPLARVLLTMISLIARVGTAAMPYVIDALEWVADLFTRWQAAVTDGSIQSAFELIGRTIRGIGTVLDGVADTLGPVIGPAAAAMSAAFAGMGDELGQSIGSILAAFVALAKGALPGLIDGVVSLGDAFEVLVSSGTIEWLGRVIGDTFSTVSGVISAVVRHLNDVGALRPLILAVVAAFVAWKVATWALNLALYANPAVWLVAGIALLIAGVIYAYHRFEWFRNAVNWAWGALKSIGSWIASNWRPILIGLTGPIGAAVVLIVDNFGSIKTAVTDAISTIGEIVSTITGLPSQIAAAATGMWDGLKTGLIEVVNWIIGKLNGLIRKANKIPFVDIGEIGEVGDDAPSSGIEGKGFPTPLPGMPGGEPLRRARGGPVPGGGPYHDRVPALLTPGEHVLTRQEVAAAGGHRGIEQIRGALRGSLQPALAGAMPDIHMTVPVQINEREVGRAASRVSLRDRARQGESN